jgi:hypothetical protein
LAGGQPAEAAVVERASARTDADPGRGPACAIAHEDVALVVSVGPPGEIGRGRDEDDEAPVRRDRLAETRAVRLAAVDPTLTRDVRPVRRLRTKTSVRRLVSPGTRFEAVESNRTNRPSGVTATETLGPFACAPLVTRLTRTIVAGAAWAAAGALPATAATITTAASARRHSASP